MLSPRLRDRNRNYSARIARQEADRTHPEFCAVRQAAARAERSAALVGLELDRLREYW